MIVALNKLNKPPIFYSCHALSLSEHHTSDLCGGDAGWIRCGCGVDVVGVVGSKKTGIDRHGSLDFPCYSKCMHMLEIGCVKVRTSI